MLVADSENEYRLTERGQESVRRIIEAACTRMASLEPKKLRALRAFVVAFFRALK